MKTKSQKTMMLPGEAAHAKWILQGWPRTAKENPEFIADNWRATSEEGKEKWHQIAQAAIDVDPIRAKLMAALKIGMDDSEPWGTRYEIMRRAVTLLEELTIAK